MKLWHRYLKAEENVTDVTKYPRESISVDERVSEDGSSKGVRTGRIAEPRGRPVKERKPPEYLNYYEIYGLC